MLICVDNSENSLRAVEFARDMLLSVDSYVTLLTVVTPLDCDYFMEKDSPACDFESIARMKSRVAASLLEEAGVHFCLSTMVGNPAEAILKASSRHKLVVMGRKGSEFLAVHITGGSC